MTARKCTGLILALLLAVASYGTATAGVTHFSGVQIDSQQDADSNTYAFEILSTAGSSVFSITPAGALATTIAATFGAITGTTIHATGAVTFDSTATITGALTQTGAATLADTLSVTGATDITGAVTLRGNLTVDDLTAGSIPFAGAGGLISQDNLALFWLAASDRLGIGTNIPAAGLHVAPAAMFDSTLGVTGAVTLKSDVTMDDLTIGSIPFAGTGGLISQDNAALFWLAASDRLGVGTATPTTEVHVYKSGVGAQVLVEAVSASADRAATLGLHGSGNGAGGAEWQAGARIDYTDSSAWPATPGDLAIGKRSENFVLVNDSGSVTIGATDLASTTHKLYVNGASKYAGGITYTPTNAGTESVSINPGALDADATIEVTVSDGTGPAPATGSLAGAAVNDVVLLGPPSDVEPSLRWQARVSAAGTVKIIFQNAGTATVYAAKTWKIKLIH